MDNTEPVHDNFTYIRTDSDSTQKIIIAGYVGNDIPQRSPFY